jgi:hypothetical protein
MKVREKQFEENPSGGNREQLFKAHAELNIQLKKKEEYWRQKAGYKWFKDDESNTKFFHTIVKRRRNRLKIKRIQNKEGDWVEEVSEIAESAITFYQKQFNKEGDVEDFSMIDE